MNCLEIRRAFAALWRRSLAAADRAAVTSHLATCARCNYSFKIFALTAPVLHNSVTGVARMAVRNEPIAALRDGRTVSLTASRWGGIAVAFAMGAAAAVALYFSLPRRISFEDAVAAARPSDLVSESRDSVFGPDHAGSTQPSANQVESGRGHDDGLAS